MGERLPVVVPGEAKPAPPPSEEQLERLERRVMGFWAWLLIALFGVGALVAYCPATS